MGKVLCPCLLAHGELPVFLCRKVLLPHEGNRVRLLCPRLARRVCIAQYSVAVLCRWIDCLSPLFLRFPCTSASAAVVLCRLTKSLSPLFLRVYASPPLLLLCCAG